MSKQRKFTAALTVITILFLFSFISSCGKDKSTRSLDLEFTLEGTWVEEFEVIVPNHAENFGFHSTEDTLSIKSVVTFFNDSFHINIINEMGTVLNERSGKFTTAGDTILFNLVDGATSKNIRTLQYRFIDKNKLNLSTISYPTDDPNLFALEFCGVVWDVGTAFGNGGFYPGIFKKSGVFVRQE